MTTYAETALITGMSWLAQAQQAIANNIANVGSTGFKRRQPIAEVATSRFDAMLRETLPTVKYREAADWSVGNLLPTSQNHHVALESDDFFRVRTSDGRALFTRNGELRIDPQGYVTDETGQRYLDPIGDEVQVRADGDITSSVVVATSGELSDARTGTTLGRTLGVFRVADRDALVPAGNGCLADSRAQDVVAVPTTAIRQGSLEASNVETVNELVNMMVVQRTFQATATILRSVGQLQGTFVNAISR